MQIWNAGACDRGFILKKSCEKSTCGKPVWYAEDLSKPLCPWKPSTFSSGEDIWDMFYLHKTFKKSYVNITFTRNVCKRLPEDLPSTWSLDIDK